jgi:hypothetical protein
MNILGKCHVAHDLLIKFCNINVLKVLFIFARAKNKRLSDFLSKKFLLVSTHS